MVQISQTEDEIKIVIEMNRLITRKPDVVLLPKYIKFNNPPIFFERHLTNEIDETASFCRIFKSEARIILVKKQKAIWPEIFEQFSKEELLKKRLEISDLIQKKNNERDQQVLRRYEQKRRVEIEKEVKRESDMRERVKQFQERAGREILRVDGKEANEKANDRFEVTTSSGYNQSGRVATPATRPIPMTTMRHGGRINVNFTSFAFATPKRESQEGKPRPFRVDIDPSRTQPPTSGLDTLDE